MPSRPPSSPAAFWRGEGFPLVPALILLLIAFVAIFADFLAPHDPQVGNLTERFLPPFWQTVATGAVLILAVLIDQLKRRARERS